RRRSSRVAWYSAQAAASSGWVSSLVLSVLMAASRCYQWRTPPPRTPPPPSGAPPLLRGGGLFGAQLDQFLAPVATAVDIDQRLRRLLDALVDVLGIVQLAGPEQRRQLRRHGVDTVDVVEDDESLQAQPPGQHLPLDARPLGGWHPGG